MFQFHNHDYVHPINKIRGYAGIKKNVYAYLVSEGFTITGRTVNMMRRIAWADDREWVTVEDAMQVHDIEDIVKDAETLL